MLTRIISIRGIYFHSHTKDFTMQYSQKRDIIEHMKNRDKAISFSTRSIGSVFHFNGELWEKRSTRTAHVFGMPHRWFYFSKNDTVDS